MLHGPSWYSVGEARSVTDRMFDGGRNQAPPVPRSAIPRERSKRLRKIGPTPLVTQAHLGDEPVIGSHPIDVKAALARRGADDPLPRPTGFDDDTLVIEVTLDGWAHA